MSTEGDFTAEDYEMLLRLDSMRDRQQAQAEALRKNSLLAVLPVCIAGAQVEPRPCTICLEPMGPGSELRMLPCMHSFHRACIDKWLTMPGAPRCPIDQTVVEV